MASTGKYLFPDAQVHLETHIHIASTAKFIGWEIQCFGRPVLNEWFENGNVKGRFNFYIDEKLTLTESLFVNGLQNKAAAMREFPMLGSLYIYPASDELKILFNNVLRLSQLLTIMLSNMV